MRAVDGVDQLRGDAYATARFAHRTFKHVADTQFAADPLHVGGLTFVDKARIARDDEEPADAGERGDDLLDHAVGEIFLPWIIAHVLERQYGDRRLVRKGEAGAASSECRATGHQAVRPDRPRDVLERLLSHVFKSEAEAARGVLLNAGRNADSARLR